jgi:hypothetical protein
MLLKLEKQLKQKLKKEKMKETTPRPPIVIGGHSSREANSSEEDKPVKLSRANRGW